MMFLQGKSASANSLERFGEEERKKNRQDLVDVTSSLRGVKKVEGISQARYKTFSEVESLLESYVRKNIKFKTKNLTVATHLLYHLGRYIYKKGVGSSFFASKNATTFYENSGVTLEEKKLLKTVFSTESKRANRARNRARNAARTS